MINNRQGMLGSWISRLSTRQQGLGLALSEVPRWLHHAMLWRQHFIFSEWITGHVSRHQVLDWKIASPHLTIRDESRTCFYAIWRKTVREVNSGEGQQYSFSNYYFYDQTCPWWTSRDAIISVSIWSRYTEVPRTDFQFRSRVVNTGCI